MRLVPNSVRASLILLLAAHAVPASSQDFVSRQPPNLSGVELPKYISVPVEETGGREFLVPLSISPVSPEKIKIAPSIRSSISVEQESSYAWHFFPLIDASRTIAFTTSPAQFWTALQ